MRSFKLLLSAFSVLLVSALIFLACGKSEVTSSNDSGFPGDGGPTSTGAASSGNTDTSSSSSSSSVARVVALADSFLTTLSSTQKSSVILDLNLSNAIRWSNLPCGLSCRNGLLLGDLTEAQQGAALALIKAAAGTVYAEGYNEFQSIRAADDYLNSNGGGSSYGDGNYIIAFLGTPSTTGKWMLQYGGHHFASNITYNQDTVISITPLHEGVEPHTTYTVNGITYPGPLATECSVMQSMLGTLSSSELSTAKISGTFSDCMMIPGSTTNTMPSTKQGIKVSALSSSAQSKVWDAIQPWLNDIDSSQAAAIRAAYKNELADTYVCYAGNSSATAGKASSFFTTNTDYVRIDGPSVWIEFICQTGVIFNNQIHYHTVMRDHQRDYIGL